MKVVQFSVADPALVSESTELTRSDYTALHEGGIICIYLIGSWTKKVK